MLTRWDWGRLVASLDSHVAAFPNKFIAKYLELLQ